MKTQQIINKKIQYSQNQTEYILKVRKRCKWCWLLLLLLLPLLLLIPLKKDVKIKLVNSYDKSVIANVPINFEYVKRDLYNFDSSSFFTRFLLPTPASEEITNNEGIALFKDVKYSVYQWLFRKNDTARAWIKSNSCSNADSTYSFWDLKNKKESILFLETKLVDLEFTVVDNDDNNEPLPDALVYIKADVFSYFDSARSDLAGKVVFKKVPYCSNIQVIGSKYGWYNDTIAGKLEDLYKKEDTLFLKQEKEIIKFFVQDLYTKLAIVGAHGQLFFEAEEKQIGSDAITNINGIGKGVFENIHKIKKFKIEVNTQKQLIFYNDTSTYEYLGYIKVDAWNKKNDDNKKIYLRPNPNPILFKNIDCTTGKGIANVINEVSIKKSNGKNELITVISDSEGNFSISAGIGDIVSIKSESKSICPNEYLPNDSAVQNALYDDLKNNENKRKIPLCKKKAPVLKFRNIDIETGVGISGVLNTITLSNGIILNKESTEEGWFEINEVFECEVISIVANGNNIGYDVNAIKINNKKYSELLPPAPQEDRDIPLKKEEIEIVTINIFNFNKAYDEIFDLYVNDKKIGRIFHNSDEGKTTSFEVKLFSKKENIIILKFVENGEKPDGNTGSEIQIMPYNLKLEYSGDNKDFNFKCIPKENIFIEL